MRGIATLALAASLGFAHLSAGPLPLPYPPGDRMMAVCFEGPPRIPAENPMVEMASLGANWVSLTPFGFMGAENEPQVRLRTDGGWWGETDTGVVQSIRWAHEQGLQVMLKPHIWLRPRDGQWRGTIHMETEEAWDQWFASYTEWICHYADLAQCEGADMLVVGHELSRASVNPALEARWRAVIAAVRERYDGPLTWSAHWEREFEDLPFWDALDVMGVSVYFPVTPDAEPSMEAIQARWDWAAQRIGEISAAEGLPVVFTEIGYRSAADAAHSPWLWRSEASLDLALQRDLYEAMFRACHDEPWFAGVFVWKWYTAEQLARRDRSLDFTPQGKPALEVIDRWFDEARGVGR